MRWDNLFDDLESQLERELSAEEAELGVEDERLRLGRLSLRDRVRAIMDADTPADRILTVSLSSGERLRISPVALGRDWISADLVTAAAGGHQCLVPLRSITSITATERQVLGSLKAPTDDPQLPALGARLGLAFVLRDLCRRRRALDFTLAEGPIHGTIDRVGRDHLDIAIHDRDEPRRNSAVRDYRIVSFDALVWVAL